MAIKCMKNTFDSIDQVNNLREIQARDQKSGRPFTWFESGSGGLGAVLRSPSLRPNSFCQIVAQALRRLAGHANIIKLHAACSVGLRLQGYSFRLVFRSRAFTAEVSPPFDCSRWEFCRLGTV